MYVYRLIKVIKWKDGDTVKILMDLGTEAYRAIWIRFAHINTPDIKLELGAKAAAFVQQWFTDNPSVLVTTTLTSKNNPNDKEDLYSRYMAVFTNAVTGISLNQLLLDNKLAVPYEGTGPKN